MTIDDVRQSKYLLFEDRSKLFSRIIIANGGIELIEQNETRSSYSLVSKLTSDKTFILTKNNDSRLFKCAVTEKNLYTLIKATNNLADLLRPGDSIIYRLPESESNLYVNVFNIIEAHKRIICECQGVHYNYSNIIKRYSDNYIIGVKTNDEKRYKEVI